MYLWNIYISKVYICAYIYVYIYIQWEYLCIYLYEYISIIKIAIYIYTYIYKIRIPIMVRVFANCLGGHGSILGWVTPKTQKIVLDTFLLKPKDYKVSIKGKCTYLGKSSTFPYTSVL